MGIDLDLAGCSLPRNSAAIQVDINEWEVPDALRGSFDVILSDMAPSTTGHKDVDASSSFELCCRVVEIAQKVLSPRGLILMVFICAVPLDFWLVHVSVLFKFRKYLMGLT